ncbi:hypothetical protein P3T23_001317 [Paraburkholderia sp. GAS448]
MAGDALYRGGRIVEDACWAHARRKFYDLYELERSPIAEEALGWIAALYVIERDIRGRTPEVRRSVRVARTAPLLNSLKNWLEYTLQQISVKSGLAKAIRYSLTHWQALALLRRRTHRDR